MGEKQTSWTFEHGKYMHGECHDLRLERDGVTYISMNDCQDPWPSEEHQAELLRILNAHKPMLKGLERARHFVYIVSQFEVGGDLHGLRNEIDAAIAAAEGGSDGD